MSEEKVEVRPRHPSDALGEDEVAVINSSNGLCPCCREGELVGGPQGGNSQNYRCQTCDQEFCLFLYRGRVFGGELVHRDEPGLYNRPLLSELMRD